MGLVIECGANQVNDALGVLILVISLLLFKFTVKT